LRLLRLSLDQFKNYDRQILEFEHWVVCLTGRNGMGKTNLLDAIHYLCMGKSYFQPRDALNIRQGSRYFRLEGTFERDGKEERVACSLAEGSRKKLEWNGKAYERLSDHIGSFPVVIIAPDDITIVNGSPEDRRKFFDSVLSVSQRPYLLDLLRYYQVLRQRNAHLRQSLIHGRADHNLLDTYDHELVDLSSHIQQARYQLLQEFNGYFSAQLAQLTGQQSGNIAYETLGQSDEWEALFRQHRNRDLQAGKTTCGIHLDDYLFEYQSLELKRFGSQGQKKIFLIALKLAQYQFLKKHTGVRPLLLLDDLFDKLDRQRAESLIQNILQAPFGQVIITDTHPGRLPEILHNAKKTIDLYWIENGKARLHEQKQ